MSKTVVEYKGPSIHERRISRRDLEKAGVEFPKDTKVPDLVWAPGRARRPVVLPEDWSSETTAAVVEILKAEQTFDVKQDDEKTVTAAPNASGVNPDGSNKANGTGGSEVLAQTLNRR